MERATVRKYKSSTGQTLWAVAWDGRFYPFLDFRGALGGAINMTSGHERGYASIHILVTRISTGEVAFQ